MVCGDDVLLEYGSLFLHVIAQYVLHSVVTLLEFCQSGLGCRNGIVGIFEHLVAECQLVINALQLLAQFLHLLGQIGIVGTFLTKLFGYKVNLFLHLFLALLQVGNHGGDALEFNLGPVYLAQKPLTSGLKFSDLRYKVTLILLGGAMTSLGLGHITATFQSPFVIDLLYKRVMQRVELGPTFLDVFAEYAVP